MINIYKYIYIYICHLGYFTQSGDLVMRSCGLAPTLFFCQALEWDCVVNATGPSLDSFLLLTNRFTMIHTTAARAVDWEFGYIYIYIGNIYIYIYKYIGT